MACSCESTAMPVFRIRASDLSSSVHVTTVLAVKGVSVSFFLTNVSWSLPIPAKMALPGAVAWREMLSDGGFGAQLMSATALINQHQFVTVQEGQNDSFTAGAADLLQGRAGYLGDVEPGRRRQCKDPWSEPNSTGGRRRNHHVLATQRIHDALNCRPR